MAAADRGSHTFPATMFTAGLQRITAADTAAGAAAGLEANIWVTPAPASSLVVSAGAPGPYTAGSAVTLTVQSRGAYGNTVTGYAGTVYLTSSDPKAVFSPALDYTFTAADKGTHTFTVYLKTAGTQSVSVTDKANAAVTGTLSGLNVTPAATYSVNGIEVAQAGGRPAGHRGTPAGGPAGAPAAQSEVEDEPRLVA